MLKHAAFWKLDLFPSSGEGMGETYFVGSIRKREPPPPSPEDRNIQFPKLCFLEYQTKSKI
jgi:hypothetical protein